jgi:cob(I)alamin adenosyltransferase
MTLYTKRGDDGTTGLIGGSRVRKDDIRVAAYGDVDETNAAIGLAIAASDDDTARILRQVQADLFALGTELATHQGRSPQQAVSEAHVTRLEQWIDQAAAEVAPLKNFILPGGSEPASRLHAARTVCRRAERAVVALARAQTVGPPAIAYLNRLSDLLFALARRANHRAGVADVPWTATGSP